MTPRRKRFWQVVGMGALTLLLLAAVLAVGLNAGPDEQAPGPEIYHIYQDGRQGLQTEAVFLNASRETAWLQDDNYSGYVMKIVLGKSLASRYIETYDGNGFGLSRTAMMNRMGDGLPEEDSQLLVETNAVLQSPSLQSDAFYSWYDVAVPFRWTFLQQEWYERREQPWYYAENVFGKALAWAH